MQQEGECHLRLKTENITTKNSISDFNGESTNGWNENLEVN